MTLMIIVVIVYSLVGSCGQNSGRKRHPKVNANIINGL